VRGLKYLAATTFNATNAAGTAGGSTVAEIIKDLMTCLMYVDNANIIVENGGWVFSPRTKYALMSLKDSQGNFYFKDEMVQGKLWGFNYRATTTQPINLNDVGSLSSKESEICFADFDKVLIGVTGELTIQPYVGGAYYDGSSVVSGISQDQTVIVGGIRSDLNCRFRGNEVVWLRGVTWGA
jgi:HK97 family phage major capsid protein